MQFSTIAVSILSLLLTSSLATPVPEPKALPQTLHQAFDTRDADAESFPQTLHRRDAAIMARVACSSTACQTLLEEASCIFDSTKNPIKLVQCLAKAGGVDSVCPCIACIPDPFGAFLSQPGVC